MADRSKDTHRLAVTFIGSEDAIMEAWRELRAFMGKTGVSLKEVSRERIEDEQGERDEKA